MVDLETHYAALRLRNPIVSASSSLGNHIDKLKRLERAGVGAVTTKTIAGPYQDGHAQVPYRSAYARTGWMVMGDYDLPYEYGVALVRWAKKELTVPVIANFLGRGGDVDSWVELAVALETAGADALEMDLHCPMKSTTSVDDPDAVHSFATICAYPDILAEVASALNASVKIPVIPKMNPSVVSVTAVGKVLISSGGKTVVMSNCMEGNPGVDIYRAGKAVIPLTTPGNGFPYVGEYLFPIHNRNLVSLKTAFGEGIEVCSGGGVLTWEHIVQRFMLGAASVQLCSALYMNGLAAVGDCLKGLTQYLDEFGYQSLADIYDLTRKNRIQPSKPTVTPAVARVKDTEECVKCTDRCISKVSADCLAMSVDARGQMKVDTQKCTGCGWCVFHCGKDAIELFPGEQHVYAWNI